MVDRVDWTTPLEQERKYSGMNTMERISYMLTKLMNHVEVVTRRTSHFVSGMKDIISSMNMQEYNTTLSNLELLRAGIVEIPTMIKSRGLDIAEEALQLYIRLDKTDLAMEQIISVINNPTYERLSRTSASASIIVDSQLNRDAARRAHHNYTVERVQDDSVITEYITTDIIAAADSGNITYGGIFEFIMKNASIVNKFTVKLISRIITLVGDDQRRQLQSLVEQQKDDVVGSTRIDISARSGINGIMVRYGLVPASPLMPLAALLEWMIMSVKLDATNDTNSTNVTIVGEDAAAAARILDAGIIMINVTNASPVEFDLHGLIDAKYIAEHKLTVTKLAGVNKTTIAKYHTAVMPAVKDSARSAPMVIHGDAASTHWYIIEMICAGGGGRYRALGVPTDVVKISIGEIPMVALNRRNNNKTTPTKKSKSSGKPKRAEINPSVIIDKNPIHAAVDPRIPRDNIRGITGLSTRCYAYSDICADTIVRRACDDQLRVTVDEYEQHHKDTSGIATALTNVLAEQFAKLNPEITSPEHFRAQALVRESTQAAMLRVFIHTTGTRGRGQDEYMITFIAKFDTIFTAFMRELEPQVAAAMPTARQFKELDARDLHRECVGAYRAAVAATARELERRAVWDNYDISLKQFVLDKRFIVV